MVFLFAWCHLSHAQECTHSLWHLLKSSRTTAPCPLDSLEKAGAACSDTLVLSKSQLHLSCTMCHNLLESFEQVVPNYSEITSRESYIFLPPEITGVAKHNWMCSQMKKPHSLQESSFQPWGAQGLWSTPKCSFLTQGKIFGIWKNTPLQAGGSRWEADASPIGMVHAEKGLAAVVAWSPLMVCCPPQAGHFPQSQVGHCWALAGSRQMFPGCRCRSVTAEPAHGAQITCSAFTNPPLNGNSRGFQQPLFKNRTISPHNFTEIQIL